MKDELERLLGAPVTLELLKHKPGRRRTFRAVGPRGRAIVKVYASNRAPSVAARVAALSGPPEPRLPRVLAVAAERHAVVLSEVPGYPLQEALLAGDADSCRRVGEVLAGWHGHWRRRPAPPALRPHTLERELAILRSHLQTAPLAVRRAARAAAGNLAGTHWRLDTVVHRDLYEEQVLLGDRVGLIDLDDAAVGPAELDIGNLQAHVDLLAVRTQRDLTPMQEALLSGYLARGGLGDLALLEACRRLALVRLACIHDREQLVYASSTIR